MNSSGNLNSFAENMRIVVQNQQNTVSLLSGIQESIISEKNYVNVNIYDSEGNKKTYSLPSYQNVINEVNAVKNSLNSLIEGKGILKYVDGTYRQVQLTPIAEVPTKISGTSNPTTFSIDPNWFFESFMFPGAVVKIDLTDKVDDTSDRVLMRRVILKSDNTDATKLWKDSLSVNSYEYQQLISLLNSSKIEYAIDEQEIKFPLTTVEKQGSFQITDIRILEGNLWYYLNGISYYTVSKDGVSNAANNILQQGDMLSYQGTLLKIDEIDTIENKIRLSPYSGINNPGINSVLSYYQDPFRSKEISVRFGAHEYNLIYLKGVNESFNLAASEWSSPIIFATDELNYDEDPSTNFASFYYTNVSDWGARLIEEAKQKKVNASNALKPNAPVLNSSDFRVVQINTHIASNIDTSEIKKVVADIESNKSTILSLKNTISYQKTELQNTKSLSEYKSIQDQITTNSNEYSQLQTQYTSSVQYLRSLVKDQQAVLISPKYRIRGFFPYPELKYLTSDKAVEIIGFEIGYRYIKEDNTGSDLKTFTYKDPSTGQDVTGTFSDWNIVSSRMKEKVYDEKTGTYVWKVENISDGTEVNINQIDIPITKGEKVQIKVRSISEAGYPDNCMKSDWSSSIIISFPENLSTENSIESIIQDSNEDMMNSMITSSMNSSGIIAHLKDSIPNTNSVNGIYFNHIASNVAYEYKDETTGKVSTIPLQDIIDKIVKSGLIKDLV